MVVAKPVMKLMNLNKNIVSLPVYNKDYVLEPTQSPPLNLDDPFEE